MKRHFILKLLRFCAPLVIALGLLLGATVYTGELVSLQTVVAMQRGTQPVLYGPVGGLNILLYKLRAVETRGPDVVVLGSSRVLNFRAGLLTRQPDAFYNAAGAGWGFSEMLAFVQQVDADHAPRILLLGLDLPSFNAALDFTLQEVDTGASEWSPAGMAASTRSFVQGVLLSYDRLDRLGNLVSRREPTYGERGLGVLALIRGDGYRNDGSRQIGRLLLDPSSIPARRQGDLELAKRGAGIYRPGVEVSEAMLKHLDTLLRTARAKNITIIGFAPSFMSSVYTAMLAGGQHTYLPKAAARIQMVFTGHGYPFYDFSDAAELGGRDAEFFDGWHPTELMCLRLYLALLKTEPERLEVYTDRAALERLANEAKNPLNVFGP